MREFELNAPVYSSRSIIGIEVGAVKREAEAIKRSPGGHQAWPTVREW
jgi:hypothetical protein